MSSFNSFLVNCAFDVFSFFIFLSFVWINFYLCTALWSSIMWCKCVFFFKIDFIWLSDMKCILTEPHWTQISIPPWSHLNSSSFTDTHFFFTNLVQFPPCLAVTYITIILSTNDGCLASPCRFVHACLSVHPQVRGQLVRFSRWSSPSCGPLGERVCVHYVVRVANITTNTDTGSEGGRWGQRSRWPQSQALCWA